MLGHRCLAGFPEPLHGSRRLDSTCWRKNSEVLQAQSSLRSHLEAWTHSPCTDQLHSRTSAPSLTQTRSTHHDQSSYELEGSSGRHVTTATELILASHNRSTNYPSPTSYVHRHIDHWMGNFSFTVTKLEGVGLSMFSKDWNSAFQAQWKSFNVSSPTIILPHPLSSTAKPGELTRQTSWRSACSAPLSQPAELMKCCVCRHHRHHSSCMISTRGARGWGWSWSRRATSLAVTGRVI